MSLVSVLSFKTDSTTKLIDARGPRFGALLTTTILTVFLATEYLPLLYWQLTIFAIGAFIGLNFSPYAQIFNRIIKPRLRGDIPTEDVRPPQFAQLVGFIFALSASIAYAVSANTLGYIVIGFALAAAFLNAAFDYCLGCEIYLLIARMKHAVTGRSNREDSYNLPAL